MLCTVYPGPEMVRHINPTCFLAWCVGKEHFHLPLSIQNPIVGIDGGGGGGGLEIFPQSWKTNVHNIYWLSEHSE